MTIELTLLTSVSHRGQEITAPRLRGLLALLAGELRAGCGAGRLVDGLWPDEQPENPAKALQILVSRARKQLGAEGVDWAADLPGCEVFAVDAERRVLRTPGFPTAKESPAAA